MADLQIVDPLKDPPIKKSARNSTHLQPIGHTGDPIADDFRVFLTLLWRHLGLPDPTPLQLDIAWFLQHHPRSGEIDHLIIMAFRGAAKSWITGAYVLWTLYRDPQKKVLVASGSVRRSVAFVNWCLNLIAEWPVIQHLRPKPNQRQSSTAFDVGPARPDQTPSVFAVGITAQIVGFRGDLIVGDDVETNTNSMTPDMREKLADGVREFDAIIKPGGQIIFLGTPQTEASIYNVLERERGYVIKIWPARFPTGKQRRGYGHRLADWVGWQLDNNPKLAGQPTEPTRFSDEDLAARELSWGKAGFALQFMLDTSLMDVDRYPLRLRDLICMSLDRRTAPDLVSWGTGDHLALRDVDVIAFDGDRAYGPASVSQGYSKYQAIRAFIDPSGRGKDETTLTIAAVLHSTPFILKQAGWLDGFGPRTLEEIAELLVQFNVSVCRVEEDFGQGMFAQLLKPYVKEAWEKHNKQLPKLPGENRTMTEIVSERAAKQQKELRILEVLEPLFQSNRIVIAKEVLQDDYRATMQRDGTELRDRYSLMYQITRLTREKDCLTHDDRVEGLAGVLGMFLDELGLMPAKQAEAAEEKRQEEYWDKFFKEADRIGKRVAKGVRRRLGLRPGGRR
ncbi:phage terminase large subunit [Nitratireductor sp. B36]|uniref:phage terminase large subunit n=1 Tax=Nitratireductor sp. B36 TaxID=2762059 RepID=UPI001E46E521|nr:phage terminase large subunit [Nitratireductor sp. B36]MCC5780524.1 phage terminase large subunit [Nitratireductor sp. B36]